MTDPPLKLLCLALAVCSAFAAPQLPSHEDILRELWSPLHDLHGSSKDVAFAAERMERESGISRSEIADALLETALSESTDNLQRKRSIGGFCELTSESEWKRLSPLYVVSNEHVRFLAQSVVLSRLQDLDGKFEFVLERISDLADDPSRQRDVSVFSGHFSSRLHYGEPSEEDRVRILSFFLQQAKDAKFARWAAASDGLLLRSDPSWPTNEARRAMMEKWRDDPNIHENTRLRWEEALAKFDGTNAAVRVAPAQPEFPRLSEDIAVQSDSEHSFAGVTPNDDHSGPLETDSTAKGADTIVPSEDNRPTDSPRFRLAWIAGSLAIVVASMLLVLRRRHHD